MPGAGARSRSCELLGEGITLGVTPVQGTEPQCNQAYGKNMMQSGCWMLVDGSWLMEKALSNVHVAWARLPDFMRSTCAACCFALFSLLPDCDKLQRL